MSVLRVFESAGPVRANGLSRQSRLDRMLDKHTILSRTPYCTQPHAQNAS